MRIRTIVSNISYETKCQFSNNRKKCGERHPSKCVWLPYKKNYIWYFNLVPIYRFQKYFSYIKFMLFLFWKRVKIMYIFTYLFNLYELTGSTWVKSDASFVILSESAPNCYFFFYLFPIEKYKATLWTRKKCHLLVLDICIFKKSLEM